MNTTQSSPQFKTSDKRGALRRFVSGLAAVGALTLAAAAAQAGDSHGKFDIEGYAGVGEKYMAKLDVKGDGKFKAKDEGDKIVFTADVGKGDPELKMKDGRQKHTVGPESKIDIAAGTVVKLTVEKSKLTFPEAGKEASGSVPAKLEYNGKTQSVTVEYKVKEKDGKYIVKKASFSFDYTKHVRKSDKDKRACLAVVCVNPTVKIVVKQDVVVEAKKS
jgi:hypothetical protein